MNDVRNISVYKALSGNDPFSETSDFFVPAHIIPTPTENEYESGIHVRYFVKKINNSFSYETSKDDYDRCETSIWKKISFDWRIGHPHNKTDYDIGSINFNNNQISLYSYDFPEIRKNLPDPAQFLK